jgi:type II secretory ATPase GspE/PulE/Tfp pilus assembly ATPase PilB-like protein
MSMSDLSQPLTFTLDSTALPSGGPLAGWPTPPGVPDGGTWTLGADEPCSIEGLNDKVFGGRLTTFDPVARHVQVLIPPARTPVTLRFSQFRRLTLMKASHPPRPKPHADTVFADFDTGADDTEYHVRLENGRTLTGRTVGHVENDIGLFLYLPTDVPGSVQRAFVPRGGYRRVDFGPRLGEVLVDQEAVSPGQIAAALLEQQRLRHQRIGEVLVEQKRISPAQLDEALEVQKRMPMVRLGEALISLNFVNQEALGKALAVQSRNRSMPLGELLVREGVITRPQLENALAVKRASYRFADNGPALGDVLVHQKTATPNEITEALAEQERLRGQRLGDVLIAAHVVKPEQLVAAIEAQSRMPMVRIGEALISLGYITEEQLKSALSSQGQDRSVPLGELLVRDGRITREDLSTALARKMGYPVVDIDAYPIESDALRKLPAQAARRLEMLPLTLLPGRLVVALEDPSRRDRIDEAEFLTQLKIVPVLPSQRDLITSIGLAYSKHGLDDTPGPMTMDFSMDGSGPDGTNMLLAALETPVEPGRDDDDAVEQSDSSLVRLINSMIVEAYNQGVSDIHVETLPGREKIKVRFRVDGVLRPYLELPHTYRQAMIARIKIMCDLDISERRRPQDGKINFARFVPGCQIELRVAMIPTANGLEDCVLRILASAKPMPIDKLGLAPAVLEGLKTAIARPYGMVLCVGPTGSGKTTTLHSALNFINTPDRKIWTAEDPVEITQAGLRQVQVNPKIDWTFAKALRAFLRADPDVIMVGEIRDHETAEVAIESSLTGHLVLSTLHTNSAAETVTRLLDMGMDPFNFADSLLAVLAQRLVRRICSACVTATPASDEQVDELLNDYLHVWGEHEMQPSREQLRTEWLGRFGVNGRLQAFHGTGCAKCTGTGMKGRAGLHELLTVSREVRRLIQKGARAEEILHLAMGEGLRTLRQDGIEKVLMGITTIEEVRATSNV